MNLANHDCCLLALDPGGSKCDALLVAIDGTVLGSGRAQQPGLSGRSRDLIRAAAAAALGDRRPGTCHLVTVSSRLQAEDCGLPPGVQASLHRFSELDGPLALIEAPAGLVAVAGTGARVSARQADGRRFTVDGLGPVLGDHGSGYEIGRHALRAVARAMRGHAAAQPTALGEAMGNACESVRQQLGVDPAVRALAEIALEQHPAEIAGALQPLLEISLTPHDRSVIAGLARGVDDAARAGDETARQILHAAADALAASVRDLVMWMGTAGDDLPLVGTGSVIRHSDIYWDRFCARLATVTPAIRPARIPHPPVVGTALAALQKIPGVDQATVRARLLETAGSCEKG